MCFTQRSALGRLLARAITLGLILIAGGVGNAQQYPYQSSPNFEYGSIDPYGINYSYDYMRYGPAGVGVSPWNPIVQAQLNLGMRTARYNSFNARSAGLDQAANLYNQQAVTQAIENQRQLEAMQPRNDARSQGSRTVRSSERENRETLPRNQVVSPDGKVLWPGRAPNDGDLAKARSAADAAVRVAVREYEANGKAALQSVVAAKELLYVYGKPAIQKLAAKNGAAAQSLFKFLSNLEQLLDSLAGV
jgi:hypothetical protein